MSFDTSQFTEVLNELLPAADADNGVIGRMPGVRPISVGTTNLLWPNVGFADVVGEKGQKDATKAELDNAPTIRVKLVQGMRYTDEAGSSDVGSAVIEEVAAAFAAKIPGSADAVILHGVNAKTGVAPVSVKNVSNITGNGIATNTNTGEEPVATTFEAALNAAIGGQPKARGIALAFDAFAELANSKNGDNWAYPNIYPYGTFMYRWLEAATSEVVGSVGDDAIDTGILAIVGDWTQLARSVNFLKTEVIETGDPDGEGDLKRANESFLRLEYELVFGVRDYSKFTVVTDAA